MTITYRVTGPLVLARDKEGKTHHVYEGGLIDWLDDDQKAHLLNVGLVEKVGASAPVDDGDDEPPADGEKPAADATNKVLIAWLVENVAKEDGSDYAEAELKPLNKAQLRELVDSVE